jgi:hypothetical protein
MAMKARKYGEFAEVEVVPLSWRGDPSETLSDFTIDVISDGKPSTRYPVHRCLLAVGERACQYFARLFSPRSGIQLAEVNDGCLKLPLSDAEAEAFPVFLDFVYGGELSLTRSSAPAMLHMASYLGCKALHDSTVDFIGNDITPSTAPLYLTGAENFGLGELTQAALELCNKNLELADIEEISKLEPDLMIRVIQTAAAANREHASAAQARAQATGFSFGAFAVLPPGCSLQCCKCTRTFTSGWQCSICKYT